MTIQCDFCVDTSIGDDGLYDGLRFTIGGGHGPKKTPQAALNLVPSGGGKTVGIAKGHYIVDQLVPPYAGTYPNWNVLIGDTNPLNRLVDVDSNPPAVGDGRVILDGMDDTYGTAYNFPLKASDAKWGDWWLKNLEVIGGRAGVYFGNGPNINFKATLCVFDARQGTPLYILNSSPPDTPQVFDHCVFRGGAQNVGGVVIRNSEATVPGSPLTIFNSCQIEGGTSYAVQILGQSGLCSYVQLNDCGLFPLKYTAVPVSVSATYAKGELNRCVGWGTAIPNTGAEYVYSGNLWIASNNAGAAPSGWTKETASSLFIPGIYRPFAPVGSGGLESGYDLTGEARNGEIGALVSTGELPYPARTNGTYEIPSAEGGANLGPVLADLANLGR